MKIEEWRDVLGDSLAVSLDLAAAPCDRPATTGDAAAHLLEAIAVLEEGPPVLAKDEPAPEIQRLELKIDLLTDLVSSLLIDRIPRPVEVLISGEGLVLPADVLGVACERIQIYPSQWLAQPLVLALGPVALRGDAAGASWRSPDPALRDALGRWVFRMHRREVARRRMSGSG
ncbi:hypothetical protein G3480_07250 [Thiorhodococcus mannitoliphagus]|uniref:Cyclic di-GMP receptor atypical PilZ domain-containing protein n=1 Tax=Thiorhodococcus mannitoliphagus TaxID=329406 RepID=A0A6P1DSF7_9GAMM|nr:PilZ domain-containing protein [Thiorhodococcus mannitoliphagus]NEX20113.1 hypothetical protein [Thiorhodococcus mannitoliphagus]